MMPCRPYREGPRYGALALRHCSYYVEHWMEFRRGFPVTLVTGVLSVLMLCICSVSASESVKVLSSVNCTVGQDCILNCTFNVTAGEGWNLDKSRN
ncbi:UNVERIFIED_CONTAM: hypothetical protein FKN15_072477 [Acipenser sinensis]